MLNNSAAVSPLHLRYCSLVSWFEMFVRDVRSCAAQHRAVIGLDDAANVSEVYHVSAFYQTCKRHQIRHVIIPDAPCLLDTKPTLFESLRRGRKSLAVGVRRVLKRAPADECWWSSRHLGGSQSTPMKSNRLLLEIHRTENYLCRLASAAACGGRRPVHPRRACERCYAVGKGRCACRSRWRSRWWIRSKVSCASSSASGCTSTCCCWRSCTRRMDLKNIVREVNNKKIESNLSWTVSSRDIQIVLIRTMKIPFKFNN